MATIECWIVTDNFTTWLLDIFNLPAPYIFCVYNFQRITSNASQNICISNAYSDMLDTFWIRNFYALFHSQHIDIDFFSVIHCVCYFCCCFLKVLVNEINYNLYGEKSVHETHIHTYIRTYTLGEFLWYSISSKMLIGHCDKSTPEYHIHTQLTNYIKLCEH